MEEFLLQVHKPGQYIGEEWNIRKKDFRGCGVRFALCFPDLYEIGMSNLGLRIIYGLLNELDDVVCERAFAPENDLEALLRSSGLGLSSLESKVKLSDFDLVGFSLGSELLFTNVLNMLELGGIPLLSKDRGVDSPLVIGGGPAALNPEPMHDFFDLFAIGEAEEMAPEIIKVYRFNKDAFKSGRLSRRELLRCLSQIEGVYVPSLFTVNYSDGSRLTRSNPGSEDAACRVKKRAVADLNNAYFPLDWIVPFVQIVHDRITLEIMRGCPNSCRFCQARSQYYPFRIRDKDRVLSLAQESYVRSGYEEISLAGLSVSDYPHIRELCRQMVDCFRKDAVSISFPSIKASSSASDISATVADIKKTGLTFAPEAGSERLRRLIAKDFNEEEFFGVLEAAYGAGYQRVKLYFMIGLPSETRQDIEAIADFTMRVSQARKKSKGRPALVNVSINTLIPKPHTAFQWLAMSDMDEIKEKQEMLKGLFRKNHRLSLAFHDLEMSFLEGVLSRGDRRLSPVILSAYKKGARFDAWGNHFSYARWQEAFLECGMDARSYLKERSTESILPWEFIDCGLSREWLVAEYNKVIAMQEDKV